MKKRTLLILTALLLVLLLSACGKKYQVAFDLNGGTLISG